MSDEHKLAEEQGEERGDLDALLQKIYNERGYDFREYKRPSLQRRINKRISDNHLNTYEQYMAMLDRTPDEYAKLFDTLLINVSEFFRDPEAWDVIKSEILPKIMARKEKGNAIRVWSAGCSTGEEPYTFAILLADYLGDKISDYEIRIYATDIDEKALNEARHGIYSHEKLKNVTEDLLNKYFTKENGFYKVQRTVRQMVAFGRQDLVSDAPISHLDLIICRNVLIYFKVDLQNRVVIKFHYALNKNGYIFFGKSESMLVGSKLFLPINKKWRIFEKISTAATLIGVGERRTAFLEESLVEQAIKEAKKEYGVMEFYNQGIIQNVSLGTIVVNPTNTIMTWNKAAEDLWGIKSDYAIGRNFYDIGMADKIPGIRDMIVEAEREEQAKNYNDMEAVNKDGARIYIDISLIPLVSPNKEKLGLIIITQDVTENKKIRSELEKSNENLKELNDKLESTNEELQAANEELETTTEELQSTAEELETSNEELQSTNEELETSNEELRSINEELETTNEELKERTEQLNSTVAYNASIIQGMRDCLLAIDNNGTITTWNPAAVQMWGISAGNAVGRNIYSVLLDIGIKSEDVKKYIDEAVNKGISFHDASFSYPTAGGMQKYMAIDVIPISYDHNEYNGAMLLFQDITEDVTLRQRITRQNRILSANFTMSTLVSRPVTLCKTLQDALEISVNITKANAGNIYLAEDSNAGLILTYSKGLSRLFIDSRDRTRIGEGFTGTIAKNREIYFIDSIEREGRPMTDLAKEGITSMIGIPLIFHDEVMGVLELFSRQRGIFSTDDMELYSGIGEQLAVAIRLAKVPMAELGRIIAKTGSIRKIGDEALKLFVKEFETKAVWLYAYDEHEKKLKIVAYQGFPEGSLDGLTYETDEGIPGEVFKTKAIYYADDAKKRSKGLREYEAKGFEPYSLIVLPLIVNNVAVGVLCMYPKDTEKPLEKEKLNLYTVFANQMALVINSALQLDRPALKW